MKRNRLAPPGLALVPFLLLTLVLPAGAAQDARETWNRMFLETKERGLKWEANDYLAEVVAGRRPGRALDIGMGQGRNALFLAELGWDVTGFDISDEGVRQAAAAAAEAGLQLEALVADVNEFDHGSRRWDLIVAMYMHGLILPSADKMIDALAPGGLLVIEGFHRDLNFESVSGGYFGYRSNELLRAFDELRILHYEDLSSAADWGRNTRGDKPIVRFVARKPLATLADLRGPFLGQIPPANAPELFAPGLVNTDAIELNGVAAPGGREFFFTRKLGDTFTMYRSVIEDGEWSVPRPLQLYPGRAADMAVDMTISADGRHLYWLGRHPEGAGLDIWHSERVQGEWSVAERVPEPVSTSARESYPCVVADGSLYFTSDRPGTLGEGDIYRAQRLPDGSFGEPQNLGAPINSEHGEGDTFAAPDESYLVFTSRRPGGYGQGDLYVSFREDDGNWGEPVNLGDTINTEHLDFCPMVCSAGGGADGKAYFFYSRREGDPAAGWDGATACSVFWVDALFLEGLRR